MKMIEISQQDQWQSKRREPLQKYKDYAHVTSNAIESIEEVATTLANAALLSTRTKGEIMFGARLPGEAVLELLTYGYSAGASVESMAALIAPAIAHWESFAKHHVDFHRSPECDGHKVPHIDLYDKTYWEALQLVCYAILLCRPELLGRIMDLLAYENDDQDALLEDLVAPYLPGRPGSTVYTRQLPYRKTKKIFAAKPDKRAELMSQYLDEWYESSRREPYHDRHKSSYFPGYWSLEAAAITYILDIDDSSYRDKKFYPRDLVDYARTHGKRPTADGKHMDAIGGRCESGQPCPREGWWEAPAKADSRRMFKLGEVMPDLGADYGQTIWQWVND